MVYWLHQNKPDHQKIIGRSYGGFSIIPIKQPAWNKYYTKIRCEITSDYSEYRRELIPKVEKFFAQHAQSQKDFLWHIRKLNWSKPTVYITDTRLAEKFISEFKPIISQCFGIVSQEHLDIMFTRSHYVAERLTPYYKKYDTKLEFYARPEFKPSLGTIHFTNSVSEIKQLLSDNFKDTDYIIIIVGSWNDATLYMTHTDWQLLSSLMALSDVDHTVYTTRVLS